MKLILIPALTLALTGCVTPPPVIKDRIVEVKIPVPQPCIDGVKPTEPLALRDRYSYDEWMAMGTTERQALVLAQGLDRKIYGDKLTAVTAGCR